MSIENLILGVNSVVVPYLIRYDSLLQNATYTITKCNSYFIIKCDRFFITKFTVLLQNVSYITNCDDFITKCDVF